MIRRGFFVKEVNDGFAAKRVTNAHADYRQTNAHGPKAHDFTGDIPSMPSVPTSSATGPAPPLTLFPIKVCLFMTPVLT